MDTDLLRSYLALVETGSYSAAARALYVSQPTVSRRIRTLEGVVGCSLVARAVPLELTEEGKTLLGDAKNIVSAEDELMKKVAILGKRSQGIIRVQDNSHSPMFLNALTERERLYQQECTNAVVAHVECPWNCTLERALQDGILDVGFEFHLEKRGDRKRPPKLVGIRVDEFEGFETHLCLVARSDALPRDFENPSLADFASMSFMTSQIPHMDYFRRCVTDVFEQETGVRPRFDYRNVNSRRYLYAEEPFESVFVLGRMAGQEEDDGIIPPSVFSQMRAFEFEDYIFRIYCLSLEGARASVQAFIERICKP